MTTCTSCDAVIAWVVEGACSLCKDGPFSQQLPDTVEVSDMYTDWLRLQVCGDEPVQPGRCPQPVPSLHPLKHVCHSQGEAIAI
jgi:hypothetical protein